MGTTAGTGHGVTLAWSVTDRQSPNSLVKTGCVDQNITADQAATTYSCSATSAGGSAAEQTVSIKRDGTAPVVSYDSVSRHRRRQRLVHVAVTVTSPRPTRRSRTSRRHRQTATTSGDGTAVTVDKPSVHRCRRQHHGRRSASSPAFKIDSQAPNAPTASLSPAPNGAAGTTSDVIVSLAATGDNGPAASPPAPRTSPSSTDTASGQTVSGTCTDMAGNASAATQVTVKLDKTAPSVAETLCPRLRRAATAGTRPMSTRLHLRRRHVGSGRRHLRR